MYQQICGRPVRHELLEQLEDLDVLALQEVDAKMAHFPSVDPTDVADRVITAEALGLVGITEVRSHRLPLV
jgi:hypothetical protein